MVARGCFFVRFEQPPDLARASTDARRATTTTTTTHPGGDAAARARVDAELGGHAVVHRARAVGLVRRARGRVTLGWISRRRRRLMTVDESASGPGCLHDVISVVEKSRRRPRRTRRRRAHTSTRARAQREGRPDGRETTAPRRRRRRERGRRGRVRSDSRRLPGRARLPRRRAVGRRRLSDEDARGAPEGAQGDEVVRRLDHRRCAIASSRPRRPTRDRSS